MVFWKHLVKSMRCSSLYVCPWHSSKIQKVKTSILMFVWSDTANIQQSLFKPAWTRSFSVSWVNSLEASFCFLFFSAQFIEQLSWIRTITRLYEPSSNIPLTPTLLKYPDKPSSLCLSFFFSQGILAGSFSSACLQQTVNRGPRCDEIFPWVVSVIRERITSVKSKGWMKQCFLGWTALKLWSRWLIVAATSRRPHSKQLGGVLLQCQIWTQP